MNCCPSQRPKCGEWHERDRNLEDAATVTGLTISRESPYPGLRNIGCKRGSERLDHQFHDPCCGISPDHPGCCNLSDWARSEQAFQIAQRGNFVVVVFRVKPTIEVARFQRWCAIHLDIMEGPVHEHKFKVGQSVSFTSGPFGRGGTNGIYKVTQLATRRR